MQRALSLSICRFLARHVPFIYHTTWITTIHPKEKSSGFLLLSPLANEGTMSFEREPLWQCPDIQRFWLWYYTSPNREKIKVHPAHQHGRMHFMPKRAATVTSSLCCCYTCMCLVFPQRLFKLWHVPGIKARLGSGEVSGWIYISDKCQSREQETSAPANQ